ncbi:MAG: S9 family peptidase, partial [Planctomycetota bacterium]
MNINVGLWLVGVLMAGAIFVPIASGQDGGAQDDPWQWLEDVTGDKSLDWVRARNKVSQGALESDPGFAKLKTDLLAILDSDARIPMVSKHGDYLYNFWRDKKNPRGLWRRTTMEEYVKTEPKWEVLLDLDALGKAENENWVWGGGQLLRPDYKRAMVSLSRGGADAKVYREFDVEKKEFVEGGFFLPEAKGSVSWINGDQLFVQTDFGPGSMTDSGYPRVAKLWKRGTPLTAAETVYEGQAADMMVGAQHDDTPGFERDFVFRNLAFYNDELFYRTPAGELVKIDAQNSAEKNAVREYIVLQLRKEWEVDGQTFPAGSLLVGKFDEFLKGDRKLRAIFTPSENTALSGYGFTKDYL